MGVIDKTTFNIKCNCCGATESGSAVEYGSSYRSSWGSNPKFDKFYVIWQQDSKYGPEIEEAICNRCGVIANVDRNYGT